VAGSTVHTQFRFAAPSYWAVRDAREMSGFLVRTRLAWRTSKAKWAMPLTLKVHCHVSFLQWLYPHS